MHLPNATRAVVSREKLVEYLLNPAHPDNGGKAAFFLALGFRAEDWQALALALCKLAKASPVAKKVESAHGAKYIVEGKLETPGLKGPVVRTVWVIEHGSENPRLVTAYPQPA